MRIAFYNYLLDEETFSPSEPVIEDFIVEFKERLEVEIDHVPESQLETTAHKYTHLLVHPADPSSYLEVFKNVPSMIVGGSYVKLQDWKRTLHAVGINIEYSHFKETEKIKAFLGID